MKNPGELLLGEKISTVKISIDIETSMRHPEPRTFEWDGRIGDDFWEEMERQVIKHICDMFS
jgi:hypothetical protein